MGMLMRNWGFGCLIRAFLHGIPRISEFFCIAAKNATRPASKCTFLKHPTIQIPAKAKRMRWLTLLPYLLGAWFLVRVSGCKAPLIAAPDKYLAQLNN